MNKTVLVDGYQPRRAGSSTPVEAVQARGSKTGASGGLGQVRSGPPASVKLPKTTSYIQKPDKK